MSKLFPFTAGSVAVPDLAYESLGLGNDILFGDTTEPLTSEPVTQPVKYSFMGTPIRKRTVSKPQTECEETNNFGIPIYEYLRDLEKVSDGPPVESTPKPATETRPETWPRSGRKRSRLLYEKYTPQKYWDITLTENSNVRIKSWVGQWIKKIDGVQEEALKKDGRSSLLNRKLLIVHGPPGSGKTTSVNVILDQAGFKRRDFDCSDGLSGEFVHKTLKPMLCYNSVHKGHAFNAVPEGAKKIKTFTAGRYEVKYTKNADGTRRILQDSRPACVVIDGIDALTGRDGKEFLKEVIRLVDGTDENDKKKASVERPLILLCNNSKLPLLREIKNHAYLVEVPRSHPNQVKALLSSICESEGIKPDQRYLRNLIAEFGCDIRACLNVLQVSGRAPKISSFSDRSLDPIFFGSRLFSHEARDQIRQEIERYAGNDLELLNAACFAQYLYTGSLMMQPWKMGDWLFLADRFSHKASFHGNVLEGYARCGMWAFHTFFPGAQSLPPRWPHSIYEAKMNVLAGVRQAYTKSEPQVQASYTFNRAMNELYPFLRRMAQVGVYDQSMLKRLGQLMLECGVSVKRTFDHDGRATYSLDPDIECLDVATGQNESAATNEGVYQLMEREYKEKYRNNKDIRRGAPVRRKRQAAPINSAKQFQQSHCFVPDDKDLVEKHDRLVWLDFRPADENAARRPIGWKDLFN